MFMKLIKKTALGAGMFAFVAFGPAVAETAAEWTQWHGANRDNISSESGLLKQWPAGGPKLLNKFTGLGGGYSSIAVAGSRIYTMGDGNESCNLLALDIATGNQIWSAKVGSVGGGGGYPGPRGTPTVDGEFIYALGQFGDLVCVESANGKEVWRKNLNKDFGGKMMSGWGYAESPLVDKDNVICTPGGAGGSILALNKRTGALSWRSKDFKDDAAYSSLLPVEFGGQRQYIQLTGASVASVAANDGRLLWRAARSGNTAVIPTPVFRDGEVFVTSGYGAGCSAFKISADGGTFKAEPMYSGKQIINHHGGVVLVGDYIYGASDSGDLVCMDFKTGTVAWKNKSVGKGAVSYADGHIYLRSENGPVALVAADPAAYKEEGRFNQPERSDKNSWAHPVIVGGKLYLRDQDKLFVYDVKG